MKAPKCYVLKFENQDKSPKREEEKELSGIFLIYIYIYIHTYCDTRGDKLLTVITKR